MPAIRTDYVLILFVLQPVPLPLYHSSLLQPNVDLP